MLPVSLGCSFLLPLRYSLTLVCPVSCVPYVTSFSGLYFFIASLVFSNIYLSCVLCTQSCLWIVLFFITPSVFSKIPVSCVPYVASFSGLSLFIARRYSPTFICHVSFVPYVASISGLSFFTTPSVFSNIYLSCVWCTLCCQFLWIVLFIITPSVFSNMYLSCVLCTLCCQFLWIVLFYCPFGILQHLFVMCLVYPMLPASLDCPCL